MDLLRNDISFGMLKQAAKTIMMVRPKHFGYDPESAESNVFQQAAGAHEAHNIQQLAVEEFDAAVDILRTSGVNVIVIEDSDFPVKPNAVFPNNWVSFHQEKTILYPMMAVNRRAERREDILKELEENGIEFDEIMDFSNYESENKFLESTGSIIFDYPNKLAYACRSERTHGELLKDVCEVIGYEPILFDAADQNGVPIYHTNVMMCLAAEYVVICLESITEAYRSDIEIALRESGHEIITISYDQMHAFAGNMLEVENQEGHSVLVMSEVAIKSLSIDQKERLSQYSRLLSIPIPTIEKYGGGSIRCMMCRIN